MPEPTRPPPADPDPAFDPVPGVAETLAPGLRRILAPNPSPMTFRGTNTYLVGTRGLAVIDPGPDIDAHLAAILGALTPGQAITHILISHAHLDHSGLARRLARETGAPIWGFGPPGSGRSATMQRLAQAGTISGGEGVDATHDPDHRLQDLDRIAGDGWLLQAHHLPGHMADHLAFALGDALLTADVVMGWATSLISPPDGDLSAFMASLARLRRQQWRVFYPGHGAPIDAPRTRVDALIAHREARAAAVRAALAHGPADAATLARRIYTDTPPALLGAAARNVLAQLIALYDMGHARPRGPFAADVPFEALENAQNPLDDRNQEC